MWEGNTLPCGANFQRFKMSLEDDLLGRIRTNLDEGNSCEELLKIVQRCSEYHATNLRERKAFAFSFKLFRLSQRRVACLFDQAKVFSNSTYTMKCCSTRSQRSRIGEWRISLFKTKPRERKFPRFTFSSFFFFTLNNHFAALLCVTQFSACSRH